MGVGICGLMTVGICDHIVILAVPGFSEQFRPLRFPAFPDRFRPLRFPAFLAAAFLSVSRVFRLRNRKSSSPL